MAFWVNIIGRGYLKEIEQHVTEKKDISLDTLRQLGSKQIQTAAQRARPLQRHRNA